MIAKVRRRILAAAILALAPAALLAGGAWGRPGVTTRLRAVTATWSPPRAIDQVPPLTQPFTGEATCVASSLCVVAGVDAVATSTDPAGGPAAWHTTLLPGPVRIVTVSCPSVRMCVGSFGFNRLTVSTDPTAGARAWRTVRLPSAVNEVNDVDCAGVHLCVLVGSEGVASSVTPLRGRTWRTERVRGVGSLLSVSCPSARLCVAAGDNGNLALSTDPVDGGRAWRVVRLHVATSSLGVACPSTRLCVGSDARGSLLVSTDPAGGRRAWRRVTLIRHGAGDLDVPVCPTAAFCMVGDGRRTVWTSTDPAAGTRAWQRHRSDFAAGVLACAELRACVAGDQGGEVAATADPLRPSHWRRVLRTGGNDLKAVVCPARRLCIAGDDAGNLLSAAGPRARHWHDTGAARVLRHRYRGGEQVLQLACATASTCLATVVGSDNQGDQGQLYAFDPRRVRATLRRVSLRAPGTGSPEYVGHLSCPRRSLCEVVDHLGSGRQVRLASTDPARPSSWRESRSDPPPRSACPSADRCLVPAGHGQLAVITRRGDRFVATGSFKVLFPGPVDQVSCGQGGGCVAVGPGGVAVSDHPTASGGWRFAASEPLGLLPLSAACAGPSACVAVGVYGKAVSIRPSPSRPARRRRR